MWGRRTQILNREEEEDEKKKLFKDRGACLLITIGNLPLSKWIDDTQHENEEQKRKPKARRLFFQFAVFFINEVYLISSSSYGV